MYVCVCNAVTDNEIREAYADGAHTMDALQDELGVATCCGCCEPTVREILATCRAESEPQTTPTAIVPSMANFAVASTG